jgi:hypothetical protein
MRKLNLILAAAGTALAVAAPAAAQYYPQQQQPYGYGAQQYGNGYNNVYGNNYGQARALQARIDAVQYRIERLDRRGGSNSLRKEARNIERQLQKSSRYGLNPYQAGDLNNRIARLEQRVNYAMSGRNGRYGNGYNNASGYNGGNGYSDRDGDHRDDRYEDDRGNRRDD